ncbi:MAG: GNAT family N-acetyltransferase [Thalassotalea sp.]
MTQWLAETVLEGELVTLRPLRKSDKTALLIAAKDGNLSSLWFTSVPNEDNIDAYLEKALQQKAQTQAMPFVVIEKQSNRIIGATRLYEADPVNRRIEIGYTWYAKSYQRTGVNTETKLLLLTYAFESLKTIAVVFQTHWHNHKSRAAIARIGAKQEGIIRNHKIDKDGIYRDSVLFSIIDNEWPAVKKSLQYKLVL